MLEPLITAALSAIAGSAGAKLAGKEMSTAVWTDYLRPLFLKDDEEEGQKAVAKIEADPAAPDSQTLMRQKLEEHLTGNPDAIDRLQHLLPGATGGTQIINNAPIGKQVNFGEGTNIEGDLNL